LSSVTMRDVGGRIGDSAEIKAAVKKMRKISMR